ncbi:MAG: SAM-dependent methyltransferase [Polaromonas sp.]|nr:SAM-dependent methyltransferase [Polaromonas sp.]
MTNFPILTSALQAHIVKAIDDAGGWLGFDRFMALALYTPGLGYYANASQKFGLMPAGVQGGGSDFVTAPELSPRFGQTLARQVAEALKVTGTAEIWEFGAGSGALALQLLDALGPLLERYTIVDVSGSLRQRQRQRLAAFGDKVQWASELPAQMRGVVLGNEVLDAMPVKLLVRLDQVWHERGVINAPTPVAAHAYGGALAPSPGEGAELVWGGPAQRLLAPEAGFMYADQPTDLRPPLEVAGVHDYLTEIHPQAEGFVRTLADRLEAGAVLLLDYGFPEHEYYHPQRSMGTVMCHHAHMADADALSDVGKKDVTAHVNFTGIALAGQDAGLQVAGYTSQGRFLLNCGLLDDMENASLAERGMVQKLVNEHEMGELFKVIAFATENIRNVDGGVWEPLGFSAGDRTHTL